MNEIKHEMVRCLEEEANAILRLASLLNGDAMEFALKIAQCQGKLFFTGVGKSYIVATKIAATFSSLGISSIAIDPLSMLHGDLGQLNNKDFLFVISNSGETDILLEAIKASQLFGCVILSITGDKRSSIAALSDNHIEIKVDEAGPFGIVPTSSTTAVMAMGDALACALCQIRNINVVDFKRLHPAGALGK